MMLATKLLRELARLFVDDGALALAILGVVLLASLVALFAPRLPVAAGSILLFGCAVALFLNVMNAARR